MQIVNCHHFCDPKCLFPEQTQFIDTKDIPVYRQTSNISDALLGNKIVDHSDVVGVWPVGAAPAISSFSA